MKRSGSADLPLHNGAVPPWLAQRMAKLGLAVMESIISYSGKDEVLRRLSDPFWFQSFGAVLGMDWHSSGITTSVMGALKKSINPHAKDLGIYICGGKGKFSRNTPDELIAYGERTGIDGNYLARCSRLSAKVDNTAVQDGFQLYLHSFVVTDNGNWTVIQQGMNNVSATARRYHWHSPSIKSFVDEPHTSVIGEHQGMILNLTDKTADKTRNTLTLMSKENPDKLIKEITHLKMPQHHDVRVEDVDLKRLGTVLWLAHDKQPEDFTDLLLLKGVGPRTLQSLTLVSEVIYGTPSRFNDPARFSFAHGGKDGHPFPVPLKVYDETISTLQSAVEKAKLGIKEKEDAIRSLHGIAKQAERNFVPKNNFNELIAKERAESWKYGGKTVFGDAKKPNGQLNLFG